MRMDLEPDSPESDLQSVTPLHPLQILCLGESCMAILKCDELLQDVEAKLMILSDEKGQLISEMI